MMTHSALYEADVIKALVSSFAAVLQSKLLGVTVVLKHWNAGRSRVSSGGDLAALCWHGPQ